MLRGEGKFTSSAGIGPFISLISRYETVDNNRTETKPEVENLVSDSL